jgi:hypothetical protein
MAPEAVDPWKDPTKRKLCQGCRAKVVMILGPNGKYIPAQKVTQLYVLQDALPLEGQNEPTLVKHLQGDFFVNHYQTCPQAQRFSKRQKKGA